MATNEYKGYRSGNFKIGATPSGSADNLSFDKSAYVVDEKAYDSLNDCGFNIRNHFDYDKDQLVTVGAALEPDWDNLFTISEDPAENVINIYLRSDKVTATFLDKDDNTLKTSTIDYKQVLQDSDYPTEEEIEQRVNYTTIDSDGTIRYHICDGWEIKDNVNNERLTTYLKSDVVCVPHYKEETRSVWNVTVNFVDTEGNEIAPSKTGKATSISDESKKLEFDMPEINEYELKSLK